MESWTTRLQPNIHMRSMRSSGVTVSSRATPSQTNVPVIKILIVHNIIEQLTAHDVITHRKQCKISCKIHFCMANKTSVQMCSILKPQLQKYCTDGCLFTWFILSPCQLMRKHADGPTKQVIEFVLAMKQQKLKRKITWLFLFFLHLALTDPSSYFLRLIFFSIPLRRTLSVSATSLLHVTYMYMYMCMHVQKNNITSNLQILLSPSITIYNFSFVLVQCHTFTQIFI